MAGAETKTETDKRREREREETHCLDLSNDISQKQ